MARRKKAVILVIDDDPELLKMMRLLLEKGGYEAHFAANGVEGLAMVKSLDPDLVILDVMMPLMSGFDVLQRLRETPETRELPVIILSSLESVDDKVKGFEAGADDYMPKPINPREALARINALLVRSRFGRAQLAHTVSVVGAKGGVGATSVAVNMATAIANREFDVRLAEMRAGQGTLRYLFNLTPKKGMGHLLEQDAEEVTELGVAKQYVHHSTGMEILMAPAGAAVHPMTPSHAGVILDALEKDADCVVLDVPLSGESWVPEVLSRSDYILLVTEPEPLALMHARSRLETFLDWKLHEQVDVVVVARVPSGILLTKMEVENEMGLPGSGLSGPYTHWDARREGISVREPKVVGIIPPTPEAFQDAASAGVPLVLLEPSARSARALDDLAQRVVETIFAEDTP